MLDHIGLAERAVSARDWMWLAGMAVLDRPGRRYLDWQEMSREELPDLRDPATQGALLEVVRIAWGDPAMCVRAHKDGEKLTWEVQSYEYEVSDLCSYDSEIEALVEALEAAE